MFLFRRDHVKSLIRVHKISNVFEEKDSKKAEVEKSIRV